MLQCRMICIEKYNITLTTTNSHTQTYNDISTYIRSFSLIPIFTISLPNMQHSVVLNHLKSNPPSQIKIGTTIQNKALVLNRCYNRTHCIHIFITTSLWNKYYELCVRGGIYYGNLLFPTFSGFCILIFAL